MTDKRTQRSTLLDILTWCLFSDFGQVNRTLTNEYPSVALLGFNLGSVCIILTIDHVNLDRGPGELCCAVAGNGAGVVSAVGRRRAPDPQPGENVLGLHLGADAEIKDNLDCPMLFYLVKTQDSRCV